MEDNVVYLDMGRNQYAMQRLSLLQYFRNFNKGLINPVTPVNSESLTDFLAGRTFFQKV